MLSPAQKRRIVWMERDGVAAFKEARGVCATWYKASRLATRKNSASTPDIRRPANPPARPFQGSESTVFWLSLHDPVMTTTALPTIALSPYDGFSSIVSGR